MGRRHHQHGLPEGMLRKIIESERAVTLGDPRLTEGKQSRQPAPGGPVGRVAHQVGRRVAKRQATADQQVQPRALCCLVGAHHAGDGVDVGDAERGVAERGRRSRQFLGMAGAAQEREGTEALQFGIGWGKPGTHPNRPCRNQHAANPLAFRPVRNIQKRLPPMSSTR
jgi:hypothetical protein